MSELQPEPLHIVYLVDQFIDNELTDSQKYENKTVLDSDGAYILHRLAARIYASGYAAGEQAEAVRQSSAKQRVKGHQEQ